MPRRATSATGTTTGFGAWWATAGSTARSAASASNLAWAFSASGPTGQPSSSSAPATTTPGAWDCPRKATCLAPRPMAMPRGTCPSPTATMRRSTDGRRPAWNPSPTINSTTPSPRTSARWTGTVNTPRAPAQPYIPPEASPRTTGIRSPLSPSRRATSSGNSVFRDPGPTSRRSTKRTSWPATTNGSRPSWPRWGRTVLCGCSIGTTSSSSTTPFPTGSRTARATPMRHPCGTRLTAEFTGLPTATARPLRRSTCRAETALVGWRLWDRPSWRFAFRPNAGWSKRKTAPSYRNWYG